MISTEALEKLSKQYHTSVFPNVIREYSQHLFLSALYKLPEARQMLFKGGTALRIIYGSPRFSEDLDFSLFGVESGKVKRFVEKLFVNTLTSVEQMGVKVELGHKSDRTSGGYFGTAKFGLSQYPPVGVEVNVSARNEDEPASELDSIANDFVPTYTIIHLAEKDIVEEKVFGALLERKKPRDFYDLYFVMRKGMFSIEQKKRLAKVAKDIVNDAKSINFRTELGVFLPSDQQAIIRDFPAMLERELHRQLNSSGV